MAFTLDDLHAQEDEIRKWCPDFEVRYKTDSWTQKVVAYFLRPFNPTYLTGFTSTFYPYVYVATKEGYEANPMGYGRVLSHEGVHLKDTKEHPFWFRFSYMFPQSLMPLLLVLYMALDWKHMWSVVPAVAVLLLAPLLSKWRWASLLLLGLGVAASGFLAAWFGRVLCIPFFASLVCLAPWPAYWRMRWELRGYCMNLANAIWIDGDVSSDFIAHCVGRFTGPDYFFMWPFASSMETKFATFIVRVKDGSLLKSSDPADQPYNARHDFLVKRGVIGS